MRVLSIQIAKQLDFTGIQRHCLNLAPTIWKLASEAKCVMSCNASMTNKWKRFVRAILEATHYMRTQNGGTLEVLRRVTQIDDGESLGFIYEQMRSRADVNLRPSRAAVENLVKMVAYDDNRASSLDGSKRLDLSMLGLPGPSKPKK